VTNTEVRRRSYPDGNAANLERVELEVQEPEYLQPRRMDNLDGPPVARAFQEQALQAGGIIDDDFNEAASPFHHYTEAAGLDAEA
jgi:hypothetical protein